MRQLQIRKGTKLRIVYVPSRKLRKQLYALHPELQTLERLAARAAGTQDVAHGFIRGRSPVTCAQAHRGYACTISMDLSDWFDTVTSWQVQKGLVTAGLPIFGRALYLAEAACAKGQPPSAFPDTLAPRQGMATSPTAANLAAVEFDARVLDHLPHGCVYTRYADDLVVSTNDPTQAALIQRVLSMCATHMGWSVSPRKTRVQLASHGRRVIVGIAVADHCYPSRKVRRKLRAAQHQDPNSNSARGLAEWCLLRNPKPLAP